MSGAGLGYSIVDARSTFTGYLGAGKILAPKSDDVAGKTEADAATDVISLWFDQVDDFLDEINDVFTGGKMILGPLKIGDTASTSDIRMVHVSSSSGTITLSSGTTDANNDKKIEHLSNGSLRISHYNGSSWSRILDMASESITFGSGTGAPIWYANKAAASSFQLRITDNGTRRWVHSVTTDYKFSRYDNTGTYQDTPLTLVQSNGDVQINTALKLNNGSHLLSGTGVPSSGTGVDGDFWFRTNGGSGTKIYFKSSGTWSAFA